MIMAFNLEHCCKPVTDVDCSCIFSGTLQHTRSFCWKFFQMHSGAFVTAVFAPHYSKYSEFSVIWISSENFTYPFVFVFSQAVRFYKFFCYFWLTQTMFSLGLYLNYADVLFNLCNQINQADRKFHFVIASDLRERGNLIKKLTANS